MGNTALKNTLKLSALLALCLTFSISCGGGSTKKAEVAPTPTEQAVNVESTSEGPVLELNADSDSGKAGALQTVYFDYNSAALRGDAKTALKENADFLKANASVEVQIEGHCDERGSVQYNIALGENRAKSVKSYLTALGVAAKRLSTISFGKERPVAFGHDESAWGKNRRGNFVVTAK
ncbi:MAG: peptidoglycan-associated lipoprotein [Bdellovibrionales bacterium GWA2_49_15]|nr:MAG: peptidoglycan-associated lipoprotein [Bdellovibrionales bacterium GWA2_49_15]HAZ14387.1 peptidoglycan-associated lipoprotein Pal [Bdellovibrionales bacterium]